MKGWPINFVCWGFAMIFIGYPFLECSSDVRPTPPPQPALKERDPNSLQTARFQRAKKILKRHRRTIRGIPHYAGEAVALNPDQSVSMIIYVWKLDPILQSKAPKSLEGIPVVLIRRFQPPKRK